VGAAAPAPGESTKSRPGPFALGDAKDLHELVAQAGFAEIEIETLELPRTHADFEDLWETTLDLSHEFHDAALSRPSAEMEAIKTSLAARFAPFTAADGTLEIPGRTLVVSASA
jgi:hypothetical protein